MATVMLSPCPASDDVFALSGTPVLEDDIFNSFPQDFLGVTHVYQITTAGSGQFGPTTHICHKCTKFPLFLFVIFYL
jgi:hypothetical protein